MSRQQSPGKLFSVTLAMFALLAVAALGNWHSAHAASLTAVATSNVGPLTVVDSVTTTERGTVLAADFVGVDVFHWHSGTNPTTNNVLSPGGADPGMGSRATLVDGDLALNTGMINPGTAGTLTVAQQATLGPANSTISGLGVTFNGGLVNGPGIDFIVFDYADSGAQDPFIVNRIDGVVGSLTVAAADYEQFGANLGTSLVNSSASSLTAFEAGAWTDGADVTQGWAGVGIDLTDLGYAPGDLASGVLLSSSVTANNVDFVAVFGLPVEAVVPEPASIAIWTFLGFGAIGFFTWRRRRSRSGPTSPAI